MTKLMTRAEVCEILVISDHTLRRIIAAGELRAVRVGGRLRFEQQEVEHYIERSTYRPVRPPVIPVTQMPQPRRTIGNSGYYPGMKVV